ncbi:GGDEF domain-containing protein [Deinococcus sp. ME38]|uniref:GGDEF domain-containing protein n=1 Tax=Deinococcus sp. ME38 TaxID=3400344 RepID=UPI003B58D731
MSAMEGTADDTRRIYYLWACAAGLLTTATLTLQAATGRDPERLYFLITQPLIALFCAWALLTVLRGARHVVLLERVALLVVTFATTSRLPIDLILLGQPAPGAEAQMIIGLLMSAVLGFLTLGLRSATTFVAVLYALHATLILQHELRSGGPWLSALGTQLALGTLLTLLAALFHFRLGYMQASQDRDALHTLAVTDPLTGLLNRRGGERALNALTAEQRPYLLAVADVDDFKRLNDGHGHAAGDQVLRLLAGGLQRADTAVRWGGEEFLIITEQTGPPAETELRDLIRHTHDRLHTHGHPALTRPVTLSVGAVHVPPGQPWQDALARADRALYAAKAAGKNRILMDPHPAPTPSSPHVTHT